MNFLIFQIALFFFLFCFVGIMHGVYRIEEKIEMTKNKKLSMFHNISETALTAQGVLLLNTIVKMFCL